MQPNRMFKIIGTKQNLATIENFNQSKAAVSLELEDVSKYHRVYLHGNFNREYHIEQIYKMCPARDWGLSLPLGQSASLPLDQSATRNLYKSIAASLRLR